MRVEVHLTSRVVIDPYDQVSQRWSLTRRGRLEEARSVLKSFLYFLYADKGGLKLLAASYTDAPAKAGRV